MTDTVCCLCSKPIKDRLRAEIAIPLEDGAAQALWSHRACLTTRLHKDVPTLADDFGESSLTPSEAFAATFAFLEMQYKTTRAEELGALLGAMALLPDGGSADPAVQTGWNNALEQARQGKVSNTLNLSAKRRAE